MPGFPLTGSSEHEVIVDIFPNDDAIVRLLGALLLEQNDDRAVANCCDWLSDPLRVGQKDDDALDDDQVVDHSADRVRYRGAAANISDSHLLLQRHDGLVLWRRKKADA